MDHQDAVPGQGVMEILLVGLVEPEHFGNILQYQPVLQVIQPPDAVEIQSPAIHQVLEEPLLG